VVKTPDLPVSAAYGYYSTNLLAKIAHVLQKDADARKYYRLAQKAAQAFHKKYYHPDGGYYSWGTQTANLLPLCFGITPPKERRKVADSIIQNVIERGGHHSTGFLGTPLIVPTLAEYGREDLAYQLLSSTEYPSLGYMAANGATTIWERWDTPEHGPDMNSRNHFAFGTMAQWLYEGIAGIRLDPNHPGFEHFIIKPAIAGELTWARGTYQSIKGTIKTHWKLQNGVLHLEVTIPVNCRATVYVPTTDPTSVKESDQPASASPTITSADNNPADYAAFQVQSGQYHFTSEYTGQ